MGMLKRLFGQSSAPASQPSSTGAEEVRVTLFEGRDRLEVKGESFYQENLRRVVSELGREVPAILTPEPENQYDPNAVSVWVGGLKVGHLSREDAAVYQSAIASLMQREGTPIAIKGRVFGGERDKPSLGIWLYHDAADFGLRPAGAGTPTRDAVFTGTAGAGLRWMDSLPTDRLAAIKYLRQQLEREREPLQRHFIFNTLEEHLYACREIFGSALAEFEEICELHHSEMSSIRPALIADFGGLPMLPTYRQMAIMKQKAHAYRDAIDWAERGMAVYGDKCLRDDAVADLEKRVQKLLPKLG